MGLAMRMPHRVCEECMFNGGTETFGHRVAPLLLRSAHALPRLLLHEGGAVRSRVDFRDPYVQSVRGLAADARWRPTGRARATP